MDSIICFGHTLVAPERFLVAVRCNSIFVVVFILIFVVFVVVVVVASVGHPLAASQSSVTVQCISFYCCFCCYLCCF